MTDTLPDRGLRAPAGDPPLHAAIRFCGETLIADKSGVLYWPDRETMIAADLHFEKGSSLARRRIFLPPYDTRSTLANLLGAMARWRPRTVIALGDSFHDPHAPARLDEEDVSAIRRLTDACDFLWIAGNHDPAPPAGLGGGACAEVQMGPLTFCHRPMPGVRGQICGHLHPCARLRRRGRSLRRPCFAADGDRLILPALGAFAGGLNVLDPAYEGVLEAPFRVWITGRDAVYPISSHGLMPDR